MNPAPRSPGLQVDSLPAEPQGKPKNIGVGSLSLLQVDLPDPGIKARSPVLQVDSLPTELSGKHIPYTGYKLSSDCTQLVLKDS